MDDKKKFLPPSIDDSTEAFLRPLLEKKNQKNLEKEAIEELLKKNVPMFIDDSPQAYGFPNGFPNNDDVKKNLITIEEFQKISLEVEDLKILVVESLNSSKPIVIPEKFRDPKYKNYIRLFILETIQKLYSQEDSKSRFERYRSELNKLNNIIGIEQSIDDVRKEHIVLDDLKWLDQTKPLPMPEEKDNPERLKEYGMTEEENFTVTEIDDSRVVFTPEEWKEFEEHFKKAEEAKKKSDGSTT